MEKIVCRSAAGISISVVSHSQIDLVIKLLGDLEKYCKDSHFELILTLNLDEELPFALDSFSYLIKVVRNISPIGFGANHNQAFTHAVGDYFCVMNPDIRLNNNPFIPLLACLEDPTIGVAAPLVFGVDGGIEDSARRFPSPLKILSKVFGGGKEGDYGVGDVPFHPDWVGGMFMLFLHDIFERLRGFDERYFLYYEDVDLCARLKLLGYNTVVCPQAHVVHHAQRSSHSSFKYLRWHLKSILRFFLSPVYWRLRVATKR